MMRYDVIEKSAGKEGHEYPYMVIKCADCGTLFQVDSKKCIPYECPVCAAAKEQSRWFELFGTPERAARTLEIIADNLYSSTWSDDNATLSDVICALVDKCDECAAQGLPGRGVTTKCGEVDYDVLLEWLRGEGEGE